MFPLGHALFGYLLYVAFAATTRHRLPYGLTLAFLLLGTQFPDVVDKPLAFVGVLPSGRAMGHSLVFAAGLLVVVWAVVRRYDRPHLAVAFVFGHLSHIAGDVVVMNFDGPAVGEHIGFLLWPILRAPLYSIDNIAPWVRIIEYYQSPRLTPELLLIPFAILAFVTIELRRRRTETT